MKPKLILRSFIAMFVISFTIAFGQTETLTIIHINDTHSNLAPIGPRDSKLDGSIGGIARAASIIGLAKMTEPNVLALHAGDLSIGDIFYNSTFGVAELQILQQVGLDAMTPGNHEFDLTPATLMQVLATAFPSGGFPLLSANLILPDSTVQPLANFVQPFTIKTFGKIKVGIFGLTTPETNILSQPSPAILDDKVDSVVMAMIDTLQRQKCDVIICLSHMGIYYDSQLAVIPGLNVIIGGHDHIPTPTPVPIVNLLGDTTYIVQADAFYKYVGKMKLSVGNGKVTLADYALIPLDGNIPEEPTVKAVVDGLKSKIESDTKIPFFSQKLTTATSFFKEVADSLLLWDPNTHTARHDTPIGNLVTDAFRAWGKTDIALEPGGLTAQPLYPGPIVLADVFRVVGYGFNTANGLGYRMARVNITGAGLLAGLEFGLSNIEVSDEYLIQAAGLNYTFNPFEQVGNRLKSVMVGNKPIDPASVYSATVSEFVINFLDYLQIPYTNLIVSDTTEFMVLAGYLSQFPSISPYRRSSIISPVDNSEKPLASKIVLNQNYPNPVSSTQSMTSISFELSSTSNVLLTIHNLLGQEVATIVNEEMQAGRYTKMFDVSKLAAETYIYKLHSGNSIEMRKMVVVR